MFCLPRGKNTKCCLFTKALSDGGPTTGWVTILEYWTLQVLQKETFHRDTSSGMKQLKTNSIFYLPLRIMLTPQFPLWNASPSYMAPTKQTWMMLMIKKIWNCNKIVSNLTGDFLAEWLAVDRYLNKQSEGHLLMVMNIVVLM